MGYMDTDKNGADMICWNQWLPHYNMMCSSEIPRVAFYVRYYKIPKNWWGGQQQQILKQTILKGDYMDEHKNGLLVRSNNLEKKFLTDKRYHYKSPNLELKNFTEIIQGICPI